MDILNDYCGYYSRPNYKISVIVDIGQNIKLVFITF